MGTCKNSPAVGNISRTTGKILDPVACRLSTDRDWLCLDLHRGDAETRQMRGKEAGMTFPRTSVSERKRKSSWGWTNKGIPGSKSRS